MSTPMIGEIRMFAGNFAPRGWALCQGQLLSIASNSALFSILGTTYGGDGRSTFGLPDLRGRFPMHSGTGPGLRSHPLGQKAGTFQITLNNTQLPSHSHTGKIRASATPADSSDPAGNSPGMAPAYSTADATEDQREGTVQTDNTGGGQSVSIQNPYLAVRFIIALQGIFPSRN
jgi:microcystin-dependent protein